MFSRCYYLLVGIQKTRRSFCILWMIFSCQGSRFFHMISFDLINFIFNCCLRLELFCFNFSNESIVYTHLFNPIFKGCGKFRNMFSVVNGFYENLFVSSFRNFLSSERRSVFDLILIGSFLIFFYLSCCFTLKYFYYSCFSKIWSYLVNI